MNILEHQENAIAKARAYFKNIRNPSGHKLYPVWISFLLFHPLSYRALVLKGNPFLEMGNWKEIGRLIFLESKRSKELSAGSNEVTAGGDTIEKFNSWRNVISVPYQEPLPLHLHLLPSPYWMPHPHYQLYRESDKQGLTGCHQSLSLRGKWKEPNICSRKYLPLSTPTPPPLHRHTIFTSSKPRFNSLSVEMDDEQIAEAAQAPFFSICVFIFTVHSSHMTRVRLEQGCTPTSFCQPRPQWVEGQGIRPALHTWQEGCGLERMLNVGSRWYTLPLVLGRANWIPCFSADHWQLINRFLWQQL